MRGAAHAGRAVAQLARIGLGVGDELVEVAPRHRRVRHQRIGADRDVDDRGEILRDVVGRHLVDRDRERQAARRVEQGRAVGRRGDHRLGADDAGRARAVLHDELLAEPLGELLRQQPRHHVDAAARRHRHDDAHRLVGVGGVGGEGAEEKEGEGGDEGRRVGKGALHGLSAWTKFHARRARAVKPIRVGTAGLTSCTTQTHRPSLPTLRSSSQ